MLLYATTSSTLVKRTIHLMTRYMTKLKIIIEKYNKKLCVQNFHANQTYKTQLKNFSPTPQKQSTQKTKSTKSRTKVHTKINR